MKKNLIIHGCGNKCIFYSITVNGMECNHPYLLGKGKSNLIIEHSNINNGTIPCECPLLKSELQLNCRISKKIKS